MRAFMSMSSSSSASAAVSSPTTLPRPAPGAPGPLAGLLRVAGPASAAAPRRLRAPCPASDPTR